jgi:hypothetical protein
LPDAPVRTLVAARGYTCILAARGGLAAVQDHGNDQLACDELVQ